MLLETDFWHHAPGASPSGPPCGLLWGVARCPPDLGLTPGSRSGSRHQVLPPCGLTRFPGDTISAWFPATRGADAADGPSPRTLAVIKSFLHPGLCRGHRTTLYSLSARCEPACGMRAAAETAAASFYFEHPTVVLSPLFHGQRTPSRVLSYSSRTIGLRRERGLRPRRGLSQASGALSHGTWSPPPRPAHPGLPGWCGRDQLRRCSGESCDHWMLHLLSWQGERQAGHGGECVVLRQFSLENCGCWHPSSACASVPASASAPCGGLGPPSQTPLEGGGSLAWGWAGVPMERFSLAPHCGRG